MIDCRIVCNSSDCTSVLFVSVVSCDLSFGLVFEFPELKYNFENPSCVVFVSAFGITI